MYLWGKNVIKIFHYITGEINENVVICPRKVPEYVLKLLKQTKKDLIVKE